MAEALLAEAERAGARVSVLAVGTWLEQYPPDRAADPGRRFTTWAITPCINLDIAGHGRR